MRTGEDCQFVYIRWKSEMTVKRFVFIMALCRGMSVHSTVWENGGTKTENSSGYCEGELPCWLTLLSASDGSVNLTR